MCQLQKKTPSLPSLRFYKKIQTNILCKQTLLKTLIFKIKRCGGRSYKNGNITVFSQFCGVKRLYRKIDVQQLNNIGILLTSMYDPNRKAFISLIFDFHKKKFINHIAIKNLSTGSLLCFTKNSANMFLGFRSAIQNLPYASIFNSFSVNNIYKIQYARAAGTFCQLIDKRLSIAKIRLPSGKILTIHANVSFGTIGSIVNEKHRFTQMGKAGRSRNLGFRPRVRGIAMNPVDHPHGGRTNGGRPSVTPWGKPAHGSKTAKKK